MSPRSPYNTEPGVAQVARPLVIRFFPNLRVHDAFTAEIFAQDIHEAFAALGGEPVRLAVPSRAMPRSYAALMTTHSPLLLAQSERPDFMVRVRVVL